MVRGRVTVAEVVVRKREFVPSSNRTDEKHVSGRFFPGCHVSSRHCPLRCVASRLWWLNVFQ